MHGFIGLLICIFLPSTLLQAGREKRFSDLEMGPTIDRLEYDEYDDAQFSETQFRTPSLAEVRAKTRVDTRINIPPQEDNLDDVLEITPQMLNQFDRIPQHQNPDIAMFVHKEKKEIWILNYKMKEVWILPEGTLDRSWIKWPKLRKAAEWITSPEPAAWLDAGTLTVVTIATWLWAQPYTDTSPKYSVQTVGGMFSAAVLVPFAIIPKCILCADRHLNPNPSPTVRKMKMRGFPKSTTL